MSTALVVTLKVKIPYFLQVIKCFFVPKQSHFTTVLLRLSDPMIAWLWLKIIRGLNGQENSSFSRSTRMRRVVDEEAPLGASASTCSPAGRTVLLRLRGAGTIATARRDQQQLRRHLQTNQSHCGPAHGSGLQNPHGMQAQKEFKIIV